jgi:hypothetical protein
MRKRIDDEAAREEARCRLGPLFFDVFSWNEPSTENVEKKFRHALGAVECVLDEAVGVITAIMKFAELAPSKDLHNLSGRAASAISFIEIARKAAWPVIKSGRPAKGQGRRGSLNVSRDQVIAQTVQLIRKQYGLTQEQASSVVSETLKSLVHEHRRAYRGFKKLKGANKAWIDKCQEWVVDKLDLSADRIEAIAKQYRT